MPISVGYTIANIAAVKALTDSQRTNGYARLVLSATGAKQSWYVFISASTATADNDLILMPDDNPSTGRWFKTVASANLGYTAENVANKNQANGYAGLDGSGLISSALLPSYVDDVLEYANLAAFPGTGATGKIYIALDTNKTYRWSGSAYVEMVSSPGSTDAITEGSTNRYFTAARVLATVLTGFSVGSAVAVAATDTILQAFGKLQALLNAKTDKSLTTNRQTASYTLILGDADKLVEMNSASANNLTIPPNANVAFPTGTQILISQYGAGQTTLVAGSGVTLRSDSGKLKISSQYSGATLIKIATNEWYIFGSLAA